MTFLRSPLSVPPPARLAHDAPLPQSAAFAATLMQIGRPALTVSYADRDLRLVRRAFGPLKAGLVSRADLARSDVRDVARAADVGVLLLNAESPAGGHGMCLHTPSSIAELGLDKREEDLRAQLMQKWRNRLNKGENAGFKISESAFTGQQGHWLLAKEAAQARTRGYRNWPEALTRAYALANRAQARIFEARLGGEIVAALLFLCHGAVATYHIGWTSPEGRARCAHHVLMWRAMQRFLKRGFCRLDLGIVATDTAPGLARFKLGTGAQVRQLGGTWAVMPAL